MNRPVAGSWFLLYFSIRSKCSGRTINASMISLTMRLDIPKEALGFGTPVCLMAISLPLTLMTSNVPAVRTSNDISLPGMTRAFPWL